jgi:hypothetical protein
LKIFKNYANISEQLVNITHFVRNLGQSGQNRRKGYIFHSPLEGGCAAEAFQSLFSHIDGKIRDGYGVDGCGRKVVGTAEVDTDPAIALSVI